jgi:hypothetical protein
MEEKDLIPKQELSYKIVGINLAVLIAYTLISALSPGGIIFDAFLIFPCYCLHDINPNRAKANAVVVKWGFGVGYRFFYLCGYWKSKWWLIRWKKRKCQQINLLG